MDQRRPPSATYLTIPKWGKQRHQGKALALNCNHILAGSSLSDVGWFVCLPSLYVADGTPAGEHLQVNTETVNHQQLELCQFSLTHFLSLSAATVKLRTSE